MLSEAWLLAHSEALAAACASAALIVAIAAVIAWRRRRDPLERERRRRRRLGLEGRIAAGTLLDFDDTPGDETERLFLHYSYRIGGVEYSTCQDVTELVQEEGPVSEWPIGAVSVKYDVRNPHDSILLSEDWTGLRAVGSIAPQSATSGSLA